jgi:hypothetical protein
LYVLSRDSTSIITIIIIINKNAHNNRSLHDAQRVHDLQEMRPAPLRSRGPRTASAGSAGARECQYHAALMTPSVALMTPSVALMTPSVALMTPSVALMTPSVALMTPFFVIVHRV